MEYLRTLCVAAQDVHQTQILLVYEIVVLQMKSWSAFHLSSVVQHIAGKMHDRNVSLTRRLILVEALVSDPMPAA